jgi:lysophospholipase L1-like esterase
MMSGSDLYVAIARALALGARERRVSCFVALGDSFTAGRGCEPRLRWPDRLAAALRARHPGLDYRNLAVDGASSAELLNQVGPALQLEPDLVTVICGANDVIRSVRPDIDAYGERLATTFDRLATALPRVAILTATAPERWRFLDLRPRTRARMARGLTELNAATRRVAASRSVPVLEVVGHPGLDEPENFLDDGLHPSPRGHERAAAELARALLTQFGIDSELATKEER